MKKKIQHFFEVMQCIKEQALEFEHFTTPTKTNAL